MMNYATLTLTTNYIEPSAHIERHVLLTSALLPVSYAHIRCSDNEYYIHGCGTVSNCILPFHVEKLN